MKRIVNYTFWFLMITTTAGFVLSIIIGSIGLIFMVFNLNYTISESIAYKILITTLVSLLWFILATILKAGIENETH